ncbi:hypothetical protein LIER_23696 [Lithospermum erythrorhizon]|uniref:Uncharacterized protein n=1 Tax=Lithospermum erythrorhizon TaxID=34254 RepID=A0AAV3R0S3_LITER
MSTEEVYEDNNVLPDTQELQEKLQIKLQLDPSQDVADRTELGELKSPIDETLLESEPKEDLSERSQAQLRRSSKDKSTTPRYINEAYDEIMKPITFEEASKYPMWERLLRK